MKHPLSYFGLSPLTPLIPKPAAPDPHATAAFILKMGKIRRAEIEPGDDDDQSDKKDKKPGQLILDAVRKRQQEGK
jgi:hypothetical protein